MTQSYKFLQTSVVVFKVLAWLALAVQVITGLILVVTGGEPVFVAGVDVPARVVGLLNFVAAALYFFSFSLMSHLLRLWLDIRAHQTGGAA
jgi:hypothetical protein